MAKMILCPYCGSESVTEEYFGEYQTGCPNCGANGPCASSLEASVSAWKDHPCMSDLIFWQFQAGCAELRLQRLIEAVQDMRVAQCTEDVIKLSTQDDPFSKECHLAAHRRGDAEDALDDMLAGLLADVSAATGGHHD